MSQTPPSTLLRSLPSVSELLADEVLREEAPALPEALRTEAIRAVLAAVRAAVQAGAGEEWIEGEKISRPRLRAAVAEALRRAARPSLRRAINATGIVLHTGLGRAVLPPAALAAIQAELGGYCNLAISCETGERADRVRHVEGLLCRLTGAEAAFVANNNAGATMLVLRALAEGREAIVSRGQLIEIGGSFRIPEIMAQSGVKLVEVGTTNRTHRRDYEDAITANTALLLRVHTSNYRIVGFTKEVPLAELVELGAKYGLPVVDDLGSGALIDLTRFGLPEEPTVPHALQTGAAVATFSADKLIGGPQGGIIVGKKEYLERIRQHPLARVLRVDKFTLAALEATLRCFLEPERLPEQHPMIRMLTLEAETIRARAEALAPQLAAAQPTLNVAVEPNVSEVGSGSLAAHGLPTYVIALSSAEGSAQELAYRLRQHEPPIFARIKEDKVLLDLRTVLPGEETEIVAAVAAVAGRGNTEGEW